jgi:hypothetical protein
MITGSVQIRPDLARFRTEPAIMGPPPTVRAVLVGAAT